MASDLKGRCTEPCDHVLCNPAPRPPSRWVAPADRVPTPGKQKRQMSAAERAQREAHARGYGVMRNPAPRPDRPEGGEISPGDRVWVLNANNEPMTKLIGRREVEIEYAVRCVDIERGRITTDDGALHSVKGVIRVGGPRVVELETSEHVEQVLHQRAAHTVATHQMLGRVVEAQIKNTTSGAVA